MELKGFTRNRRVVVNTDLSDYEAIKRERVRRKAEDSLRGELDQLRGLVMELKRDLEEIKAWQKLSHR